MQTTSRLRGVPATQTAIGAESPAEVRLSVLYMPAAARDRMAVRDRLTRGGAAVSLATDITEALQVLAVRRYGLIVVDLAGEASALSAIRVLHTQHAGIPVVGVMDPADPSAATKALSAGATDLLPWPLDDREVQSVLANARDRMATDGPDPWIARDDSLFVHSPAMRLVAESVRAASARKTGILLVGEVGTGRSVVARSRHGLDNEYVVRPFVHVDCSASAGPDLERRMFGTEGANDGTAPAAEPVSRSGALVSAQGGTLYLTNLVEAPARVQARLAGILRDREAFSLDVNEVIRLDVRVITAGEPGIDSAASDGRLRRDLYERVAQVRIEIPPLRRRREDLPLLAARFPRYACQKERCGVKRFSRAALALLAALPWRGNAPEMAAAITAIVRDSRQPILQVDDVLDHVTLDGAAEGPDHSLTLRDARSRFEREYISRELMRHHGRVGDAARALGIQRTNLYRKVRQLKVSKSLLSSQK